jgi:hypothetical protein
VTCYAIAVAVAMSVRLSFVRLAACSSRPIFLSVLAFRSCRGMDDRSVGVGVGGMTLRNVVD